VSVLAWVRGSVALPTAAAAILKVGHRILMILAPPEPIRVATGKKPDNVLL
jgi:hypothetical protein